MLWGRRNAANKYHWCVWGVLPVSWTHWVCPLSRGRVCFPSLHCSGSRLLFRELSEEGPGFYELPRSKQLRLRNLGTPQRCILCWAYILCSSEVRAAQVIRCLESTVTATYCLSHPCLLAFWVYNRRPFSGGCRLSRTPRRLS